MSGNVRQSDAEEEWTIVKELIDKLGRLAAEILHGEEPIDYKYEFLVMYKARGWEMRKKTPFYGFRSEESRKAAHEKANAFLAKAAKGK